MNLDRMEAIFERIHTWKRSEANGWASKEVAARFEAGARGEIDSELIRVGPNLHEYPAAIEILRALEQTPSAEGPVLLDFGCANGVYGELLATNNLTQRWQYVGVDVSPLMIEACRVRFPHRRFEVVEEGKPLPFPDESVDIVLASGVLEIVEHTEFLLQEFERVTRSAIVLYRVPCRPRKPSAMYWQTVKHAWGKEEHTFQVFNEEELEATIEAVGLQIVSREISPASGEWTPPDDPEPVQHFLYRLGKTSIYRSQ